MSREPLIDKVESLLDDFGFEVYWPNKTIQISTLKTPIRKPSEIQVDIIAKIGCVGFLIEVTTQKEKNEDKIEKFIQKHRAVKKSSLPSHEIAKLFSSVPQRKRKNFRAIKKWKAIYIGTSPELVYEEIIPKKFSDSEDLTIINIDDWNYITAIHKAIGKYARFEFISFLGLNPSDVEDIGDTDEYFDFHKLEGRNITKGSLEADVYSFAASPNFLLKTCRVFRFAGLPLPDAKSYYQRMLSKRKMDEIRKFIGQSPTRCFPTPVIVVLPSEVKPQKRGEKIKLKIPFRYGSLNIIDGQHRIYAYAHQNISKEIQEKAELLVNGIKFNTNDSNKIGNFSARTFIDINREQMKVKTSLIYSVGYDAMGDISSKSLAGKIILLCNQNKNSPLHDLFEGRTINRKSKLGIQRTSMVEVVNALEKIIEKMRDPQNSYSQQIAKMLGITTFPKEHDKLIKTGEKIIDKCFNRLKNVLPDDWTEGTESIIFRSKYIAAFIFLLSDSIDKCHNFTMIEKRLKKISDNIKLTDEWKNSGKDIPSNKQNEIFHKKRAAIPSIKFGIGKILKGLLWYENNSRIWPELIPKS